MDEILSTIVDFFTSHSSISFNEEYFTFSSSLLLSSVLDVNAELHVSYSDSTFRLKTKDFSLNNSSKIVDYLGKTNIISLLSVLLLSLRCFSSE